MDKLVDALEAKLKRSFVEMVRSIRSENTIAELASKISRGDLSNLLEGIDIAVEKFTTDITAGYVKAGQKAARRLNEQVPRPVKFNMATEDAMTWIEETQETLTRALIADQQALAQSVIANGRARGMTDQQIAEELRDSLGMSSKQYEHVASYRRALEAGDYKNAMNRKLGDKRSTRALQAAADEGTFLGQQRIDAMVRRYSDRWVAHRASTVALAEANGASHAAVDELYRQAIENGDVDEEDVVRVWQTRGDHRVRGSHRTMHGQKRRIGVAFVSGKGSLIMFPCDPNADASETAGCRCRLRMMLKRRLRLPHRG